MNNRINTTWISFGFAGLLTVGKFLFYYLSGSVAVLSEAWHSFSDLATSLLILFSLYRARMLLTEAEPLEKKLARQNKDEETAPRKKKVQGCSQA